MLGSDGDDHWQVYPPCYMSYQGIQAGFPPFFILSRAFSEEKVHSIDQILKEVWNW